MGSKEKKSTIKFQKTKLKGVVKRRKEVNKFKRQIVKRQLRRGGDKNPHKGKKAALFMQRTILLNRRFLFRRGRGN
jgi:hypothetical protein